MTQQENQRIGRAQGVAYAVGYITSNYGEYDMAYNMIIRSRLKPKDFKHAFRRDLECARMSPEVDSWLGEAQGDE